METRRYVLTMLGVLAVLALLGWVLFSGTDIPMEEPDDTPSTSETSTVDSP